MSDNEKCCTPNLNQSCCEPVNAKTMEETVKETYGKLWANQKASKPTQSKKTASLLSAHDALLKELAPRQGMKVLDIGSGNGETVLTIAEKVGPTGKAVGLDFSPEGIALARERAKQRKLEKIAEFHLANALELPFPDNSFDAVISECVVCLIQDKQKAIDEKTRVLKPGGRVVMHDVISWAPMPKAVREDKRLYCECVGGAVSLSEYKEMMKKAGLVEIKTVDFTRDVKKMLKTDLLAHTLDLKGDKESQEIVNFLRKGGVGYALLVGTKR